jgi:hypothetical protein
MPNGIDGVAVIVVVIVVVVVVGARKPERVQQVHELISPAIVRFLLSAFVRLYLEAAQNLGTRRDFQQQQKQKGKRQSAGAGTGRDERCNHCCIGRPKLGLGPPAALLATLHQASGHPAIGTP